MSDPEWHKAEAAISEAVVTALWRQWRTVGAGASGKAAQLGIVDPESLILSSLGFQDIEARLWVVMTDWLREASRLISVQRFRNLLPAFAAVPDERLRELGQFMISEGGDPRWRSVLGAHGRRPARPAPPRTPSKRRTSGPVLDSGPVLLLRLRAAFGVGLKADLLGFLIAAQVPATVAAIARALGYSVPPVFRGLQDLVAAGFARTIERPAAAEYVADARNWSALLGSLHPPFWRPWKEVCSYAIGLRSGGTKAQGHRTSEYAAAVRLRQLGEAWWEQLERTGIFIEGFPGRMSLPRSTELSDWIAFNRRLAREIEEWI